MIKQPKITPVILIPILLIILFLGLRFFKRSNKSRDFYSYCQGDKNTEKCFDYVKKLKKLCEDTGGELEGVCPEPPAGAGYVPMCLAEDHCNCEVKRWNEEKGCIFF